MRTVILLAPGAWEPLTEGRKLFVADLAEQLRAMGLRADILYGQPGSNGLMAIAQSLRSLHHRCAQDRSVEGVVVFPYGTFTGVRRWANYLLLRCAARIGRRFKVPAVPLFYSCAGVTLERIERLFGPCLAVGVSHGSVSKVDLAISRQITPWKARRDVPQQLLFLCGYQSPSAEALHGVLHERGLIDLLGAGNALADDGFELTVAIPFLRDAGMRDRVQALVSQHCPRLSVRLLESVNPADVFDTFDAFVFPYRVDHAVFVPTSLLEAMTAGIPVVTADLSMYRSLTHGPEGRRCTLYEAGDAQGLARSLNAMKQGYASAVALAEQTAHRLREPSGMARSAQTILDQIRTAARARS